jgi:RimJ/RimL family protein N-acetyltransferase
MLTEIRTNPAHTDPQQTLELMLRSMPTPTEPWNQRWAIMLRPISKVDSTGADTVQIDTGNGVKPVKPKMIGIVGTPRRGELAYKLSPGYWGNGYMSEALKLLFEMWWGMNGLSSFPF